MMPNTLTSALALAIFASVVSSPAAAAEKMKAASPPPLKKESKEKSGTVDMNIGVGELQEGKGKPKLKKN